MSTTTEPTTEPDVYLHTYTAQLAQHVLLKVAAYEKMGGPAVWISPRADLGKRLALAISSMRDDDEVIALIRGTAGRPSDCDEAIRLVLAPPPNLAMEQLQAARDGVAGIDTPTPRTLGNATLVERWLTEQSRERLQPDIARWLLTFAKHAHAAEVERLLRATDTLSLDVARLRQPDAQLDALRRDLERAQSEGNALRQRVVTAQTAENDLRALVLELQAQLRAATAATTVGPDGFTSDEERARAAALLAEQEARLQADAPPEPKPKPRTRKTS